MPGNAEIGVSFDDVHSYTDWGLRLKEVKIGIPEAKTVYVDVPGSDGSLDLTEAQNGGVKYGMRTLEFIFDARNCSYQRWTNIISRIARDIEGKQKRIVIDIDSGYYYTGRCHISTEKTNEVTAEIGIECNCDPYKLDITSSNEPWKWDTFNFVEGVIRNTSDIEINNTTGWQSVVLDGWDYNETLRIVSNAAMKVKYRNYTFEIAVGENIMYDIELFEGKNELFFQGSGTITLIHRGGTL